MKASSQNLPNSKVAFLSRFKSYHTAVGWQSCSVFVILPRQSPLIQGPNQLSARGETPGKRGGRVANKKQMALFRLKIALLEVLERAITILFWTILKFGHLGVKLDHFGSH
jgi:hypothetical protein